MLDEAHTIKSPKSQISLAAAALTADRRWCLTGTPIQVNIFLEFFSYSIYVILYVTLDSMMMNRANKERGENWRSEWNGSLA